MISSTKTSSPLYADKLIITSLQTGSFACVQTGGTFQNVGNGFSITITKTGGYIISCKFVADLSYTTNNSQSINYRLAVDGVEIDGTPGAAYKNVTTSGSFSLLQFIQTPLTTFTVGQVITLQAYKTNTDTAQIYYSAGSYEGFLQAELIDTAVPVRDSAGDLSLTEIDTGRRWIDGKRIYRKVINFGALPNAATKNVAHGITFDQIIDFYGITSNGTNRLPLSFVDGTYRISPWITTTNVTIATIVDMTAWTNTYVVIEFTK